MVVVYVGVDFYVYGVGGGGELGDFVVGDVF